MIETKTPNKYSEKVFNYSYFYEETEFKTLDDLIKFHSDCEDYGIAYSGLSNYISYHFPATAKGRTIYREKIDYKPSIGILIMNLKSKRKEK